jgi:hypothetical protein
MPAIKKEEQTKNKQALLGNGLFKNKSLYTDYTNAESYLSIKQSEVQRHLMQVTFLYETCKELDPFKIVTLYENQFKDNLREPERYYAQLTFLKFYSGLPAIELITKYNHLIRAMDNNVDNTFDSNMKNRNIYNN